MLIKSGLSVASMMLAVVLVGCDKAAEPAQASVPMTGSVLPPKYLSVPEFKSCLATQSVGSYEQWCQSTDKPEACPDSSWVELNQLEGEDKLPACS